MNAIKEFLFNVPLPMKTYSYSPFSHKNIIEATYEQLDKYNLIVNNEFFNINGDGRKLIGGLDIIHSDVPHLGMRLAFRNSYDKSMSVAFSLISFSFSAFSLLSVAVRPSVCVTGASVTD